MRTGAFGIKQRHSTQRPGAGRAAMLAAVVLATAGAGCGASAGSEPAPGADASKLWGTKFIAVSFEREGRDPAVVPVRHTRFWFGRHRGRSGVEETIGWNDGCNSYGGWMRVRGNSMRVWNVAGTLVACVQIGEDGKPHAEGGPILMNFFRGTLHWRLHGGRLAITSGDKTLRLREADRKNRASHR